MDRESKPLKREIMKVDEASEYLQIHQMTLYRLMKQNKIPAFRVGGQWRLKRDHIDKWINNRLEKFVGKVL